MFCSQDGTLILLLLRKRQHILLALGTERNLIQFSFGKEMKIKLVLKNRHYHPDQEIKFSAPKRAPRRLSAFDELISHTDKSARKHSITKLNGTKTAPSSSRRAKALSDEEKRNFTQNETKPGLLDSTLMTLSVDR
jgi:hypothetical protein